LVQGLASTEAGDERRLTFREKIVNQMKEMHQSVVMAEQSLFPLHKSGLFLFTAALSLFITFIQHEVHIHDE
jgi:hypothetical protein